MAKLPEPPPPSRLAAIPAATVALPAGTELWRIYFSGGEHPTNWAAFRAFGPVPTARFDHHDPPPRVQDRRILYGARSIPTCFAEVFQEPRVIDRRRGDPRLAGFALRRDVTLLDLTGNWPTRAGASMAIHSGPRARARHWSRAAYAAYPDIAGLLYCSSMDGNAPAVALYERAERAMPDRPVFDRHLADPALHATVLDAAGRFGYGVV